MATTTTAAAVTQTRLDRLVTLLDSGSTPAIRATAARQLGQIAGVRVRGEASSSSSASQPAASATQHANTSKRERSSSIKIEEDEDEEVWVAAPEEDSKKVGKTSIQASLASSSSLAADRSTAASVYRGVDGDWEQAVFLIARVLPLLRSKAWDTRIAAAQAIEAICVASGVWDPELSNESDLGIKATDGAADNSKAAGTASDTLLSFDGFSLPQVLSTGKKLLSSAGNEYDVPAFTSVEERLAHAKRDMQRLGLGSMAGVDMDLGVDVEKELMNDGPGVDATASSATNGKNVPAKAPSPLPAPVAVAPPAEEEIDVSKLSARERNQLKRKRKMESKAGLSAVDVSKTRVVEHVSKSGESSSSPGLVYKTPSGQKTGATDYLDVQASREKTPGTPLTPRDPLGVGSSALAIDAESLLVPRDEWPFALISALLLSDLFSPAWEVRHGAALGLRELYKAQGEAGGKIVEKAIVKVKTEDASTTALSLSNAQRHAQWCDDAAIRILCVLTLDRLSDFVFDQVVAPVRETAGQALASLLKWMDEPSFFHVHAVLLQMVAQEFLIEGGEDAVGQVASLSASLSARRGVTGYAWEVRHAGLLGLRYEVLVRQDLLSRPVETLAANGGAPEVLHDVTRLAIVCLRDGDDDVRSVAAATLVPIVDQIVERMPDVVGALLEQLWSSLSLLKDDLSSSTGGVMDLLAKLVQKPEVVKTHFVEQQDVGAKPLSALIPRLYPFFRHTIASVRLSVLSALLSFLAVPSLPKDWIDEGLVRLLFQNLIVEERVNIREASNNAWQQSLDIIVASDGIASLVGPHVPRFFSILMTPLGTPIDHSLFYRASGAVATRDAHNVDKGILAQDLALVGVDAVIRGRLGAAQALGATLASWPQHDGHASASTASFAPLLSTYLTSSSALQKCLVSVVVQEWAERTTGVMGAEYDLLQASPSAAAASVKLISILESPAPATYAEMVVMLQRIQRQCSGLYGAFVRDAKVSKDRVPLLPSTVDATGQSHDAFTIDMAKDVLSTGYEGLMARVAAKIKATVKPALEDRRAKLIAEIGFYQSIKEKQDSQVAASAAAATIALRALPAKLNPVIRSVMNSVKFEENADLQRRSARAVARLIELCRRPGARADPSDKIVKNLCAFVCQDTTQTPIFERAKEAQSGIMSLTEADTAVQAGGRGPGRPAADVVPMTEEERQGKNIRRGAECALQEISHRFGAELFKVLPVLWQSMSTSLVEAFGAATTDVDDTLGQAVIDCCTLVQAIVRNLDASLHDEVSRQLLPCLANAIKSRFSVVRTVAAKTFARLTECMTQEVMLYVVQHVVPLLDDVKSVTNRQGAMETIGHVVRLLDLALLPYMVVLIVPVLGRMSDADEPVRLMATNTFASLVKMVPLEAGLPDPPGFPEELTAKRQEERQFLAQLLDGRKVEAYVLPVTIRADLRNYQREGVSWMAFLAKFHLHGVLCDDMGLGKTLQSICILASKHHERRTARPDAPLLPSLIVCPPTLTSHWCHEIKQYSTNLRPLLYAGQPAERARLQAEMSSYDCVIASYDAVRNDIDVLSKHDWLYCILDEGHAIKSAKTKTTRAVKQIRAQHRLILSGTPIQNNVLELWSLFDFLMPGFLGTEKQFMDRYGRPILASRDAKVSAREHERASLALDALHKQVLPFLLRRMKEDVLADLPPKIIQDVSCEMSDVQRQLYDEYMRQQNRNDFDDAALQDDEDHKEAKQHVFQTLQYLRKLVCHPSMVFDDTKPGHRAIAQQLQRSGRSLHDLANAPKLLALKQLLQDCGIGGGSAAHQNDDGGDDLLSSSSANGSGSGVSQHRVLIFCQQRQMLDIIEQDLFRKNMPGVTYARLDGTVAAPEKRFAIVQRFNADPSIDVLLLTTSVGGLGLTLTGADTVIFVEHDWNPMKDMQAMDRAHRLGQKKVVNVYRLITRDTLEEQIMGLQRFKVNVAGNVVNQQNKTTDSMETDQILDLFDAGSGGGTDAADAKSAKAKGISQKALLASLEGIADTGDDYAGMQEWSVNTAS